MTIEEICYNAIGNCTSIDILYNLCRPHKNGTVDRKLRLLTQKKKILPIKKGNAIIAYMRIQEAEVFKPTEAKKANDILREYLKNLKADWSTYSKIIEIEKAINSKYLSTKNLIIKKYGLL